MENNKMEEAFQIFRAVIDMVIAIKRPRPEDWKTDEPPPKKIRLDPFKENGAKAVKLPNNHVVLSFN